MKLTIIAGVLCLSSLLLLSAPVNAASSAGLTARISQASGLSESDANKQIEAVFAALTEELKEGKEVTIRKFGRFYVQTRAPRDARNPKTGAVVKVGERKYPRFASSDSLKGIFNPKQN